MLSRPSVCQYKDNTQLSVNYPIDVRKRLVNVDSRFRDDPTNSSSANFVYRLANACKNVTSMRVASVEIPNSWYEISAQLKNNYFYIEYLGTSYKILIEDGNYTTSQLMTAVRNSLTAAVGALTWNVAYNSVAQSKVAIYWNAGASVTFLFDNFLGGRITDWGLGYSLGFRKQSYVGAVGQGSGIPGILAEAFSDQAGFNYIFLNVDDYRCIEHTNRMSGTIANIAKIIVNENKGAIIFDNGANLVTKEIVFPSPQNITAFRVQLKNGYGDILDLNSMDFSFTLELTEIANAHLYEEYRTHLVYNPSNT